MANLTLSQGDELLQKTQELALPNNTFFNALVWTT
jgi:hypothetical protein